MQAWVLLSVLVQPFEGITEKWWLSHAKQLAKLFIERYQAEDVTPYLHVFVYHIGYYLQRYGSLEAFANYAIEGRHHFNKVMISNGTSGFSNSASENNIQMQQLRRSLREDFATLEPQKKRARKGSWATRSLAKFQDVEIAFRNQEPRILLANMKNSINKK